MKILMTILSALVFALSSGPTVSDFRIILNVWVEERAPYNEVQEFYKKAVPYTGEKFAMCSALFYSMLSRSGEVANARLREMNCLDRFTGFFWGGESNIETQEDEIRIMGDLLVLRMPQFTLESSKYFERRIAVMEKSEIEAISDVVIVLAGNSGGGVDVARHFLPLFAPDGGLQYLRAPRSRCEDVKPYEVTTRRGILAGKRYTFIVDRETASMAEFTVATVGEWHPKSMTVIGLGGDHTIGKSSLTHPFTKYGLFVPCGHWEVPGRAMVIGVGIVPDRVIVPEEWGWDHDRIVAVLGLSPRKLATATPIQ